MPLTVRTNGNRTTNLIGAAWFNDYYNLLTGAMVDQEITIANGLTTRGLFLQDSTSTTKAKINSNGSIYFDDGALTSDGAGNLTAKSVKLTQGKINGLAYGSASVSSGGTTITHNLGVVPTFAGVTVNGSSPSIKTQVTNLTATQMTASASSSCSVWWIAVA